MSFCIHGWAGGSAWHHREDVYRQTGLILFNDMSFPCETGWLDLGGDICCDEATVTMPFGGSIASVNNTRAGWSLSAIGEFSDRHTVNSYRGFLQKGYGAGETWLAAHLDDAGVSSAQAGFAAANLGGTGAWVLAEHILYGDPLIRVNGFKNYSSAQTVFPPVATNAVLASAVTVSGTNAVVTARTAGDIVFSGRPRLDHPA